MIKTYLLLAIGILFHTLGGYTQTINFSLAAPQPSLIEVYGGSFASGDIDGDGDQDLLMTGLDPGRETALYFNDGMGNFTEVVNTPFPEASFSVTIFKDLDSDGDLDLFFSGTGFGVQEFTHIYLNNGLGVFTQQPNPALPQFEGGGAAIEDVDNDGDLDILISALDNTNNFVADVYINDGNANFTATGSTAFAAVKFSYIAFIDVENDGDKDVIISGEDINGIGSTKLYLNDSMGNFTLNTNSTFEQLAADNIDVADTDTDGDLDILMSGVRTTPFAVRTILYTNDGTGTFTAVTTNLQETFAGKNAFADFDNDGDQDILIVGSQMGGLPNILNIIYQNTGNNVFNAVDTIGGEYLANCVVEDFNGDGLKDIIIEGFVDNTNVYWNTSVLTSIDHLAGVQLLTVYPNPSNGTINIETINTFGSSIKIYNNIGELVFFEDDMNINSPIQLNQSPGLYLVVIETNNSTSTTRLILK